MKLVHTIKNSLKTVVLGGALLINTHVKAQETTSSINNWKPETYELTLEMENDQTVIGRWTTDKKTDSKDHEGLTVGLHAHLTKYLENKKIHAIFCSKLYQRSIADRKISGFYRAVSLSKTEIAVGVETKPNNKRFSHTGLVLLNQLQSGESHMTKIRDWYHRVWSGAEFITLLNEFKQESIGASYDVNHTFEKKLKYHWNMVAKTSAGIDAYIGTIHQQPKGSTIKFPADLSFKYLSNVNAKGKFIINYQEPKHNVPKFSIIAKAEYKQYMPINFEKLSEQTEELVHEKKGYYPFKVELQNPPNRDLFLSIMFVKSLYSTKKQGIHATISWKKELSRESVLTSIDEIQQQYGLGLKYNF